MPYKHYRKYKAVKTIVDGEVFDSKREAKRYEALKALAEKGEISNLRRQVPFVLIPEQRLPDVIGPKGGIKKGALLERECKYIADFVYELPDGGTVVEDCKGYRTPEYRLKKKLFRFVYGIEITES